MGSGNQAHTFVPTRHVLHQLRESLTSPQPLFLCVDLWTTGVGA